MEHVHGFLTQNQYVVEPTFTLTTVNLREAFVLNQIPSDDITVMCVLISYPKQWTTTTDIFKYIKPKARKRLRKNKKTFFVFDASTEGFSTIHQEPYYDMLYHNAKMYGVDPERIFFFSSNMKDVENLTRYNMVHKIEKSINVFPYLNFEPMILGVNGQVEISTIPLNDQNFPYADVINKRFDISVEQTKKLYRDEKYGKIFLSLSRVNRPHRTLSAYDIFNSEYFKDGLVSHDQITDNLNFYSNNLPKNSGITEKHLGKFKKALPLTVDTEDFKTNHALGLHSNLHDSTLFQIVNETFVEDYLGTSLFWSEKTFRSMYHMQPFVIWGQPGANQKLNDYGYRTYKDWFNLSFDDIKDNTKRWRALWKQCQGIIDNIRKMPLDRQQNWKFRNEDVLKHNFEVMLKGKYKKKQFKQAVCLMRDLADEKSINS